MMTIKQFELATKALALANGISDVEAASYMAGIGDTPELAQDGRVIVRDSKGAEIVRLILPASE